MSSSPIPATAPSARSAPRRHHQHHLLHEPESDPDPNRNGSTTLLNAPRGVTTDSIGNIYIADAGTNTVSEISATTGVITTIAGNAAATALGDGGPATSATLNAPTRVAVDAAGDVFIADTGNNRVLNISTATGIITTIAGSGTAALFSGDGGPATAATLSAPTGLTLDAADDLYIADTANQRTARVAVTNTMLNHGGAQQGQTSAVSVATITNFGNTSLVFDGIVLSPQLAQSFTTGNDCTPTATVARRPLPAGHHLHSHDHRALHRHSHHYR